MLFIYLCLAATLLSVLYHLFEVVNNSLMEKRNALFFLHP